MVHVGSTLSKLLTCSFACLILTIAGGDDCVMKRLLFCGDQLTAERARGSQENRVNAKTKTDALLGLEPAISDWHAEANFLQARHRYLLFSVVDFLVDYYSVVVI